MAVSIKWGKPLPVWCFDMEARPGPWGGADFTFRDRLSMAGGYEDGPIRYLAPGFSAAQLERFVKPLREQVLVVAHNGFRYDLPFLQGVLIKMGCAPLRPLLVSDTYAHLPKRGHAFSASLGNLAQRFDIHAKGHMSEPDWEAVYAGEPAALRKLKEYNVGDVVATWELRKALIGRGLLGPARVWRPRS